MADPIWLVGLMGAGKTTVAPLVAARLGRPWADTDRIVERSTGRTIRELLAESEQVFRRAEAGAVESLLGRDDVVATGGGAVTSEAAAMMMSHGFVVWLRASVDTLLGRLGDVDRPLLDEGPVAALERLRVDREVLYEQVADATVDTDDLTPDETAEMVVRAWANASSEV